MASGSLPEQQTFADPENKTQLSKSWFGDSWHKLMEYNQFFSMFFLNGGLLGGCCLSCIPTSLCSSYPIVMPSCPHVGGLIAYTRLKEHRAAKQVVQHSKRNGHSLFLSYMHLHVHCAIVCGLNIEFLWTYAHLVQLLHV